MAFEHGKSTSILITKYDMSSYFRTVNTDVSQDVAEVTGYQATDSARIFITGNVESSANFEGLFDGGPNAVDAEIADALTGSGQIVSYGSAGWSVGSGVRLALSKSTTYSITSPSDDVIQISLAIQGDAGIPRGVALHDIDTARSATVNGASVDNLSSTSSGGVGHLHLTSNSRDGVCTIKIQDSPNDSVWSDLISFTNTVASTTTSERLTVAGTVNRYVRGIVSAVAGSSGSINFALGFARYS